jgi:DNA-binding MarR family transcriptional regulator
MDSRFKEWVYIEGLMQSAYHEAALKMNLSDSEFWILYVFNFHQEGCNQSVLYKEACLTKSTVNSAIRKMEQKVAAMWNYPTRSSAIAGNPTRP